MAFDPVFSGLWLYGNAGVLVAPAAKCWNWNEVSRVVTTVTVNTTDEDEIDRTEDLALLEVGDRLHLRNTSTADNWAMFDITAITDHTTWVELGVSLLHLGTTPGLPTLRQRVLFDFVRTEVQTTGPLSTRYDDIVARVASLIHVPADDVWVAAAVDSAIEFVISKTNRELVGLPDDPLTVNGIVLFSQRLYLDTPNGAQVAIGDPSFDPIFQPESLWKHVRHYFDRLDVAWGIA
jgi:hypothetical protein